jgi:uncharacterized protein YjbI with pentapeptide repeats
MRRADHLSLEHERAHADWLAAGRVGPGRVDREGVLFERTSLGAWRLGASRFRDVTFRGVGWSFARVEEAEFDDVTFEDTPLALGKIHRARFTRCVWTGTESSLALSLGEGVRFEACHMAGLCIERVRWPGASLVGCDLSGVNFQGSDLRGATFRGCDLRGADLEHVDAVHLRTRVEGAVWLGCRVDGVRWPGGSSEEALRREGAILDTGP